MAMKLNVNDRTHKALKQSHFENWKNDSNTDKRV